MSFRLAEKYGLQLVAKERFDVYYEKVMEEGRSLLGKMQALEVRVQDNCNFIFTSVITHLHLKEMYDMKMWSGFIWHRIGISGRHL
jgi:hypothetical protein